jgi:hypothetical protein
MEGERDREIERKKGNDEDKCKKESAVEIKSSGQNKWACISIKQTNSQNNTHSADTIHSHPPTDTMYKPTQTQTHFTAQIRSDPIRSG